MRVTATPEKKAAETGSRAGRPIVLSSFRGNETAALEREADLAARHVARFNGGPVESFPRADTKAPATGVQRTCGCAGPCNCDEAEGFQRFPDGGVAGNAVGLLATGADLVRAALSPTIVEDGDDVSGGQIERSAFLQSAGAAITSAADEELAPVGRSTANCPYIEFWWGRFRSYSARRMERAVILFAQPGSRSPHAYLHAMSAATRQRVRQWIASGSAVVPDDMDALSAVHESPGQSAAQAKTEHGASSTGTVSDAILARLGAGRTLDGSARARMERGFGRSFRNVRIHTDAAASQAAAERGALALTVGSNVLFRQGQYRPGTMSGDVLLAHELAHTLQQSGGAEIAAHEGPEVDADRAAVNAVAAANGSGSAASVTSHGGISVQACTPTRKRCPPGTAWGNVAHQTGTVGAGSFGCACVYRCVPETFYPQEASICPATGCRRINYEIVDENYQFQIDGEVQRVAVSSRASPDEIARGWGASSTPLTGQHACLCSGVDIEGQGTGEREGVSITPIAVDATDVVGPLGDVAAAARDRRAGRSSSPQTDPTTGVRLPEGSRPRPRVVHPTEIRAREAGLFVPELAPRLDRVFHEADPAIIVAIHATAEMTPGPERTVRLRRLLDWAESRPTLPDTIREGPTFGRGGTGSVAEIVGHPELASKQGAGRAASEAAAMVELELAGIPTVYLGERPVEGGGTRLVLRRIDGVGSKDIIGRTHRGPDNPALAREYEQFVTARTVADLEGVYARLQSARLNVGDFQFIIRRSDGAVFLNDPTGVTSSSGPSGSIRGIIDRFAAIVRRRTRGTQSQ